jgi:hypothetical protein
VRRQGRTLPERLAILVKIEARHLEVLDHPLGELLLGIVRRVLAQDRRRRSRLREMAKPIEKTRWSRRDCMRRR